MNPGMELPSEAWRSRRYVAVGVAFWIGRRAHRGQFDRASAVRSAAGRSLRFSARSGRLVGHYERGLLAAGIEIVLVGADLGVHAHFHERRGLPGHLSHRL